MLIEFKVANFRSFRACQTLSMTAAGFSEHLEANTFDPSLAGGFGRLLRSAAVYGPNAGGKTNLLRALQAMQSFVINSAATPKDTPPPYTPFKLAAAAQEEPTTFEVAFVQGGVRYEYGFSVDSRRVCKEWLNEYVTTRGRELFKRVFDKKSNDYIWNYSTHLKGQRASWSKNTRPESLFLSTAIQLNSQQLLPAFEWFQRRLVVITGPLNLNTSLTLQLLKDADGKDKILPFLKEADLGITDFVISREPLIPGALTASKGGPVAIEHVPGEAYPSIVKVTFSHQSTDAKGGVGLDFSEESGGTQLLFVRAGAWLNVLNNGEVLLVDEIDSSLHPLLTRYLIGHFHNHKVNVNNAQLIFSTHNTSLLDKDIFRRDQIWFIEKGAGGESSLYPLTEFKPRSAEALERGYMQGRYGAIPILASSVE